MGVFTSTKQFRLGLNLINPWWLSGASIDLDLDNGRYYDSSLSALKQPLAVLTDYLSCSRASTGYAKTSAGSLTQFGNNALRLTDLGLVVEDARTNLQHPSEDFSSWSSGSATAINNQTTAPNGASTAAQLTDAGIGGGNVNQFIRLACTSGSVSPWIFSIYLKNGTNRWAAIALYSDAASPPVYTIIVDLTTGAVTDTNSLHSPTSPSNAVETLGNGWYRCSVTFTPGDTSALHCVVGLSNSATPSYGGGFNMPIYTGNGGFVYVWGVQLENAAFPSSYIPTTTTSATRAADNITITGTAQTLIAAGTASIVAQVNNGGAAGVAANLVDSNGTNLLGFDSSNHGLASITATLATANTANRISRDKVGLAWSGAGRSLVLNGGTVATDASAQTPSSTQHVGSTGSANFLNGIYERLTVWNSKLADATLQALTAP